jgi:hypothetical protein
LRFQNDILNFKISSVMNPKPRSFSSFQVIRLIVCFALSVAFFNLSLVKANGGDDLNRFDDEESYLVEGQSISFRRVADEIVLRFVATNAPLEMVSTWSQSSGHSLLAIQEIFQGAVVCRVTNGFEEVEATLQALRSDSVVRYAYPVYRGVDSGNRVFLNDEVVAKAEWSDLNVFQQFNLQLVDTLSPSIKVFRLPARSPVNPFKVSAALRTNAGVIWAEPNLSQEILSRPPGIVTNGPLVLNTNLVTSPPFILHPILAAPNRSNGNIVIQWFGMGTLQSAPAPCGPWLDVSNATNPYVASISESARFFRIKTEEVSP